jgi:hypothetical protein
MNKLNWLMAVGVVFLLAGCSNLAAPTVTLKAIATEVTPTQVTIAPSVTNTLLPKPSLTSTHTVTQTFQPFSTELIAECRLPCWWGITPGVTIWDQALDTLSHLKNNYKELSTTDIYISIDMLEGGYITLRRNKSNIIDDIDLSTSHSNGIEYYDLLSEFGEPSNIYLFAYEHYQGDYPPATVILYYEGEGILATYEFNSKIDETNNIITVCPIPEIQRINLSPKGTISSFDAIRNYVIGISDFPIPKIEDSSNITKHDFYTRYRDKNQKKCFESPTSLWP